MVPTNSLETGEMYSCMSRKRQEWAQNILFFSATDSFFILDKEIDIVYTTAIITTCSVIRFHDYLTSFPFPMNSNKSFVIFEVALSWNLTSGFPCEGPFRLRIDFCLNMKWPCCGGYLSEYPFQSATQPGCMRLSEETGFILALQLASVDRVQMHMGLPYRQWDRVAGASPKHLPSADDMFIWAGLCSNWDSSSRTKFQEIALAFLTRNN